MHDYCNCQRGHAQMTIPEAIAIPSCGHVVGGLTQEEWCAGAVVCVSVAAADTCLSVAGHMARLGDGPAQRFRRGLRLGYWLAGAGAGVAAAGLALFRSRP